MHRGVATGEQPWSGLQTGEVDASVPFADSVCIVCNRPEEEDLTLLCDGPDCSNEAHMFCLKPLLTTVPEGNWLCPVCDTHGSTKFMQRLWAESHYRFHDDHICNSLQYRSWLVGIQQLWIPMEQWKIEVDPPLVESEYDITDEALIGYNVRIYSKENVMYHIGRILDRRYQATLGRWEHYVYFKRCLLAHSPFY
jgi:hypothetical protein